MTQGGGAGDPPGGRCDGAPTGRDHTLGRIEEVLPAGGIEFIDGSRITPA